MKGERIYHRSREFKGGKFLKGFGEVEDERESLIIIVSKCGSYSSQYSVIIAFPRQSLDPYRNLRNNSHIYLILYRCKTINEHVSTVPSFCPSLGKPRVDIAAPNPIPIVFPCDLRAVAMLQGHVSPTLDVCFRTALLPQGRKLP